MLKSPTMRCRTSKSARHVRNPSLSIILNKSFLFFSYYKLQLETKSHLGHKRGRDASGKSSNSSYSAIFRKQRVRTIVVSVRLFPGGSRGRDFDDVGVYPPFPPMGKLQWVLGKCPILNPKLVYLLSFASGGRGQAERP